MAILITSDEQLRSFIPNVLASAASEPSFYTKVTPFLDNAEVFLLHEICGDEVLQMAANLENNHPLLSLMRKVVVYHALMEAVPLLDLVLTPNGFGIVSNGNIAPASKERVTRLLDTLESLRDNVLSYLLLSLQSIPEWQSTSQHDFFGSTLFPTLEVCDKCGVKEHRWQRYLSLREEIIPIEEQLAGEYFSQELMEAFRGEAINGFKDTILLRRSLIQSIRTLIVGQLLGKSITTRAYFDIVNVIRNHPAVFPEWQNTETARLFEQKAFENKKKSGGYWF